ncbi:MAG TPA: methylated-DNA--[protein]-cysteine S-methyltransferase [Anaerolineaceae bacterium]|nr:methylated-DNA--[protein]-cysteine S-methyltransferase [Anaerolineaceae bacterium]HPN52072.1 methylated-DNA--[protein]-cysteine S-methyltransferase [Anaerolineaceae bacterium]
MTLSEGPIWYGQMPTSHPMGVIRVVFSRIGMAELHTAVQPDDGFEAWAAPLAGPQSAPQARQVNQALRQIDEYLAGKRRMFEIPIDWSVMTPFQEQVLRATYAIPYGEVRTYGEVALAIGKPNASRAVGGALGRNPMGIVIPCHRVVNHNRDLHGFSAPGGLDSKAWLLRLEGHTVVGQRLA